MTSLTVTKSNSLIQSSYKLTLNEQRLVLACIAQLDSRRPLPKDNLFTVNADDFAEQYGIEPRHAYEALSDAASSLYQRDIRVFDGKVRERFRWVQHVRYHAVDGRVELMFSTTITPYLTMLSKQFTSYQLQDVSDLRSNYSIRLYELLMQFKKTGHLVVSLADFKEWLQIDEVYHRFSNLKMRVIDPAVAELQAKSGLTIVWQGHRNGRAVQRLEFRFTMNGDPPPMVDHG